jgi:CheY-like chemotaxis protein
MRPIVAIPLLLATLLALSASFFFKSHSSVPDIATSVVTNAISPVPVQVSISSISIPVAAKKIITPEERQTAINEETERLAVWAMNNDPQSLSNILGDLTSPEKEIRTTAIEAVKQFDSTDAIPVLKAMAANMEDHDEADALLEAADFLALPDANLVGSNQELSLVRQ